MLQIQAARQRLVGLSLWWGWGARWWGYATGLLLIIGPFAGFYAFTPGIFVPGLAGSELAVLFAAGFILALVVTLAAASLAAPRPDRAAMEVGEGEAVVTPQLRSRVYVPQGSGPLPALCMVPEMESSAGNLRMVAAQLRALGFVMLSIDWMTAGDRAYAQGRLPRYPDVLALVPAGVDYLLQRPEVDKGRIGVIGFGLGGDLALRAAGADEQIAAAVAVSPCLTPEPCYPSLDLLRQRSFWQAVRWRRRRRAQSVLVGQLNGLAFLPRIPPRPLLILHPPGSPLSAPLIGVETHSLLDTQAGPSWGQEVAQVIGHWCEEHL